MAGSLREEVEADNAAFCAALSAGDLEGVADAFDAEAVMLAPGAPAANGHEEIRAYFEQGPRISGPVMRPTRIEEIGDAVAEVGDYTMTVTMPGEEPFEDAGKYLCVRRRDAEGRLRLWLDTFHSDRIAG